MDDGFNPDGTVAGYNNPGPGPPPDPEAHAQQQRELVVDHFAERSGSGESGPDCPECPEADPIALWQAQQDGMTIFTTDNNGNFRYYYPDGSIEETDTEPWKKALQGPLDLVLVSPIMKQVTYLGKLIRSKVFTKAGTGLRRAYEAEVKGLSVIADEMRVAGNSSEEIARTLHQLRRELGVKYKSLTPDDLLQQIYQRNLERYGDRLGPSIDFLRNRRGMSWEEIINSATKPGGKDLGF